MRRRGEREPGVVEPSRRRSPPRVGLVVYGELDTRSGGYVYDRRLADALAAHGWAVSVISLPERPYRQSILTNARPGLVSRFEACDVVLADAYCSPSLALVNRRVDTPVVALVHYLRSAVVEDGLTGRLVAAIERAFLSSADAYVFNSTHSRDAVATVVDDTRPAIVAPPAGDRLGAGVTSPIPRDRLRADPFQVVSVGTVTPRKGGHALLAGLSQLTDIDWQLRVVGDVTTAPDHVASLRALAQRRDIADAVEFTGRVTDETLRATLQQAHVLAVPSRYEPFGIVDLEGMTFGLPAIASAHGGASDVVDPTCGVLVPPADPDAVADAVRSLATDRDRLARLSHGACERARSHPTWADTCEQIRRFLTAVIGGRAGGYRD